MSHLKKLESYRLAANQIRAQMKRHTDRVATLANVAAILKERFPSFFWVGFYFLKKDRLILGPFQGPPACMILTLGKGVCAEAVKQGRTIRVPDVHRFPGHVACDPRSKSEIVVPCHDADGSIQAVLDVDSERENAFDAQDQHQLEMLIQTLRPVWEAE